MTLEQAAAEFESGFIVHPEVGCPNADYEGPLDMSKAPTGERYEIVCSGCILDDGEAPAIWYANQHFAISDWLGTAKGYAGERGGRHLYWRRKPEWVEAEFVPVDQVAAINSDALKRCMRIKIGYVYSRFVVSTMDPSGKEDSE